MGEPRQYYPSNGCEGDCFISNFCAQCIHEKFWHTQQHGDKQCNIFTETLFNPVPEWIYDEGGHPTCTKWQYWDWGKGGDDGWNEPPEPVPYNPNQLLLFDNNDKPASFKNIFHPQNNNQCTQPQTKLLA